ncbi:hypothetical protein P43SY_000139 [Pythium insidiosum]|uniref:Elicitin-like protein n=1 Tax=Pythium insidiosum TaxID=114742 RepID=A0AAD5LFN2_PYTIN|nr:hypothetical protein P43SY_000139 [Pythium insidiosum]
MKCAASFLALIAFKSVGAAESCDPIADAVALTMFNSQPGYIRACPGLLEAKSLPAGFCKDEKCISYMRDNYKNLPNCIDNNLARHAKWNTIINSCDLSNKGAPKCSPVDISKLEGAQAYVSACNGISQANTSASDVCAVPGCVDYMRKNLDTVPPCLLEDYAEFRTAWSAILETCSHPNVPRPTQTRKPVTKAPAQTPRPTTPDAIAAMTPEPTSSAASSASFLAMKLTGFAMLLSMVV